MTISSVLEPCVPSARPNIVTAAARNIVPEFQNYHENIFFLTMINCLESEVYYRYIFGNFFIGCFSTKARKFMVSDFKFKGLIGDFWTSVFSDTNNDLTERLNV